MNRLAPAVLALALLAVPGIGAATPLTLTFDTGAFDEAVAGGPHGPYDWVESGARIAGFWAVDVGTAGAYYEQGHTHPTPGRPADTGTKEATHSWKNDLQGLEISLESGGTFDLISIDYLVIELDRPDDAFFGRLPWSFDASDPKIIATDSFDPTLSDFESQWTAFSAVNERPWRTLDFSGFEDLTSVMISQTAHSIWLDNIVIDVHDGTNDPQGATVPEPAAAQLLGLGLAALASRCKLAQR